ncbi:MAG: translation initiation factor IF-3 [Chloroflexota bacterium]
MARDLRVNQMIRIPQVRVVDEEGAQLGVMPTPRALEMAQERGYDLVEVAPMASPPVVKFLDFGQYKYELTKRDKENKRRQRSVTFKEVRLTPKIGSGDFETKVHRAIEFLEEGDRIKVTVRFRGRELTHPELGRNMLTRFTDRIKEHGTPERAPLLEGKSMHLTVASLHKPKEHEPQQRHGRTDHAAGDELPAEAPAATEEAPAAAAKPAEARDKADEAAKPAAAAKPAEAPKAAAKPDEAPKAAGKPDEATKAATKPDEPAKATAKKDAAPATAAAAATNGEAPNGEAPAPAPAKAAATSTESTPARQAPQARPTDPAKEPAPAATGE